MERGYQVLRGPGKEDVGYVWCEPINAGSAAEAVALTAKRDNLSKEYNFRLVKIFLSGEIVEVPSHEVRWLK